MAPLSGSKWPPRAVHSLELPNLAARGAHFEPTVWIPRVESRAENFPQYRQYGPLTPPSNRISVEDLGDEKNRVQSKPKNQHFRPISADFFLYFQRWPPTPTPSPWALDFLLPLSDQQRGTAPLSCKAKPEQPFCSHSIFLPKPTQPSLSPSQQRLLLLQTINVFQPVAAPSSSDAQQQPVAAPSSSDAQQQPKQQQSSIPAAAATPGEEQ